MRKRILSGLLACAVCVGMLPVGAMAAETDSAPGLAEAAIAGETSTVDASGNLYLTLPSSTNLANATFALKTTEAVDFVTTAEDAAGSGELYAYDADDGVAQLRFAIDLTDMVPGGSDVNFNTPDYSIDLTSTDDINWTGTFNQNFNATVSALGQAMNMTGATLRAGIMENGNDVGNEVRRIRANNDASNTQLVIYDPNAELHTVTYQFGDDHYTWTVPDGAPLYDAELPSNSGYEGWYDENDQKIDFAANPTVEENMTLHAEEEDPSEEPGGFLEDLEDDGHATLNTVDDWDEFVANANAVEAGQWVELGQDINLGGASYQAIQFEGNFNGNGKTISNATFTANGDNCGMFARIDGTQKIVNLNLNNISANGLLATYAGVLAGQVYGGEGLRDKCLVQNVHVRGGSVSGRTAGALVGFSFVSTIKYCSAEGTSVTGLANAAGISGLTYADIDSCYSKDVNLFGLQFRGRGGIAGKLLESGKITNCWYDYEGDEGPVGEIDRGEVVNDYLYDDSKNPALLRIELQNWIANQDVWKIVDVDGVPRLQFDFDCELIAYEEPTTSV